MDDSASFGAWLKRRRSALLLSRDDLAQQVGCAVVTLRKIEADERRPSQQIATRLAALLELTETEQGIFVKVARAELAVDRLPSARPRERLSSAPSVSTTLPPPALVAPSAACFICGALVVSDQQFCTECGTRLVQTCHICGMENRANNRFCNTCGRALEQAPPATAIVPERSDTAPQEERRWATVVFADISGYTALSERMDPEDVHGLVAHCIERMSEQIRRFGGRVINVMGDAVLAVFGAPTAHDDDAARAVRSAIAMCDSLRFDDPISPLTLHIGINTGEVLATISGPPEHRNYTVLGDTVNTADRLLKATPSGSVLVGEETYRATRHAVQYREALPVVAKGKEQPIRAWQALAVSMVPEARPLGMAPLVGRDEELALLQVLWERVTHETQPHLVLILGEPGIGKSRLSTEFEQRLPKNALVLHGRCLPYGEALGYGALSTMLKEAAGITADDDTTTARAKLGSLVAEALSPDSTDSDSTEVARHMALLGGLDVATDRQEATPDQRILHTSVRQFLEAFARQQPLCLIFDDLHWADDALLDLIEFVAARTREAILTLAQARPELLEKRSQWGASVRGFTSLSLETLDTHEERALILSLCAQHGASETVAEQVGQGASGNPLFAEELVAMIAEGKASIGTPSALKPLILARLDSLPQKERRALQRAAVFGKVFWAGGLGTLVAPSDVTEQLDRLEQKDLIRALPRSLFRGERQYTFKHDLICDVAYETLPRAERRACHRRIADWIEAAADMRVEEYLDVLAHHALQAIQQERALGYLIRAAERAHRAAARRQETMLLAQAIAIADQLGRHQVVAELHAQRGKAFVDIALWVDARLDLEAALAALPPEHHVQRAHVLVDLAKVCFWDLDPLHLQQYATEALALADVAARNDLAAEALTWLAQVEKVAGNLRPAMHLYRQATARSAGITIAPMMDIPLTLYLLGQTNEAVEYGRKIATQIRGMPMISNIVYGLPHLGLALAATGRYAEATQVFEEAQRLGHEYETWPWLARTLSMSAGFHLDVFDFAGNETLAEEACARARAANFLPTFVSSGIDLLLNFARRQEVGRTEKLISEVTAVMERVGGWHGWLWQIRLAEAHAEIAFARGDWDATVRWANNTIEQSRVRERVKYQVLGLGTRGQAYAAMGRHQAAITDLRGAVHLARTVSDPALFLRVAAILLAIDGDDLLAVETHTAAERIRGALPNDVMRGRFEAAEPIRLLSHLRQ